MNDKPQTKLDRAIDWTKNAVGLWPLIFIAITVIGFAELVGALGDLRAEFRTHLPEDRFREEVKSSLITSSKMIDSLLLKMAAVPEDQRVYAAFSDEYRQIDVELRSLALMNEVRPINEISLAQLELFKGQWDDLKAHHVDQGTLGNFFIEELHSLLLEMQRSIWSVEALK
ncbi:hypothetical protein ACUXV3_03825 [Roseobacteraceae bacterium NS-SX3]